MKLNPDCIRDLLLYLENTLSVSKHGCNVFSFDSLSIRQISQGLPTYQDTELVNTIMALEDGGFISASADYCGEGICVLEVNQITYSGYQFIEAVRPDDIWGKIKKTCLKVGSFSLDLVMETGTAALSSAAISLLNL